jgi:hypothetical protein
MDFKGFMLVEQPSSGSPPPPKGGSGMPMGGMGSTPPGGMGGPMSPMGGPMGGPMPPPMGGGLPPMGLGPGGPPMGGMPGMPNPQQQPNLEIKGSTVWQALDKFLDNLSGQEEESEVESPQQLSRPSSTHSYTGTPAPSGKRHLL